MIKISTILQKIVVTLIVLQSFSNYSFAEETTPRLPVENFFKYSEINSLSISPTGKYFAAKVKINNNMQLAVMLAKNNKIISVMNFGDDSEVGDFGWLNNERVYASMVDKVGPLEKARPTGYLFSADADGGKKRQLLPTPPRPGKALGQISAYRIVDTLDNDEDNILIDIIDSKYSSIYKLNIYSGRQVRVAKAAQEYGRLYTDNNQVVRLSVGTTYDKEKEDSIRTIYYRDNNKDDWQLVDERSVKSGEFSPISFTKDNKKLYINAGTSIKLYDPKTKELSDIIELPGDAVIENYIYDLEADNRTLIGVIREPGHLIKEYLDTSHPDVQLMESISAAFPDDFVRIINTTQDGKKLLVIVYSDVKQGTYYLFDRNTNKLSYLLDTAPHRDYKQLAKMEPFSFIARDGLEIRGYLTLPTGKSKNLPLVQVVHGGPYGVKDSWGYNPEAQYFANLGYAVMQVNYRGSGGRGSSFIYDHYQKMGMEMQDDLTDAVHWAVKEGIADKDRVCIYGASYGGYAAMMGVVKEPDLYKCAVPYVGVYDIAVQKDESDTRLHKSGRKFLEEAWNAYDEEFVKERSAIYHLDKLKAALLLVHGRMDKRVPIKNYELLTEKLDKMNYPYESLVEDHEGHGFRDQENVYNLYKKVAKFLDKHIGQ
ncbi:alpha/beta hydrolase family protein [Thalassotalea piscium]|uniref:Dipeptidyl aminopeptidase/acylaminoacyl peptidase n=1 Tax=Thalassotalea piscium TaxID=1230533 RepID=A0A7X0NEC3_9GAMM|nr:prolyl oligopeptidase family serine peptidase [Thalassotalea piscium]MBB6541879.1 dipeptidyl aminopeptidase/acylaminoacyl peptidase [Thalassotalea piscium]